MLKEAVYHQIDSSYAYAISKDHLLLKLRTKKQDIEEINVAVFGRYKRIQNIRESALIVAMKKVSSDQLFDYYEVVVEAGFLGIQYVFELKNNNDIAYYGNYRFWDSFPHETNRYFTMPTMGEKDLFTIPQWASESIVYQIFPERFDNGDISNDPATVKPWYSKVVRDTMLGGDLQGIVDKLEYLEDLGINTIYLTPIFKAGSNHKYDTYDYFQIDPQFGTMESLKELVSKAHSRGIRIILDAVFNHCGVEFAPFQDVVQNGEASQYKEWFDIQKYPVELKKDPDYATFGYHWGMPKLMTKNQEVVNYLLEVATFWIREADIDGWRLDVANEIDHDFWRQFRKAVKAVKPDALIIGEVWHDTSSWLQGDQYDSTMNYLFRDAVRDFIAYEKISVQEFDEQLGFFRGLYKLQAYNVLWNLIDSHDTARFLHLSDENTKKLQLAALFQMTFTGVPFVYYGDEVGMTGGNDPDCRGGMVWDEKKQNKSLLAYYKKLISIRKKHKALTHGTYETIVVDNDKRIYGFRRQLDQEIIDIYINNGYEEQDVTIYTSQAVELLSDTIYTGKEKELSISIPKKSGVVLKM